MKLNIIIYLTLLEANMGEIQDLQREHIHIYIRDHRQGIVTNSSQPTTPYLHVHAYTIHIYNWNRTWFRLRTSKERQ